MKFGNISSKTINEKQDALTVGNGLVISEDNILSANGYSFSKTFLSTEMVENKLIVTHSLNTENIIVVVYDNTNKQVLPTEIAILNNDSIELDFTNITIEGEWSIVIFASNLNPIPKLVEEANIDDTKYIRQNGKWLDAKYLTEYEVIPTDNLPDDYPKFTVTGESQFNGNFFITPHTNKTESSYYISILNPKGQVLKYHKLLKWPHLFRTYKNSRGEVRYTYLETVSNEEPTDGDVQFYENCQLIITDKDFNTIDKVRMKANGFLTEGFPVENHDYMFIDDGHYIVATYHRPEGSAFYENVIQEIKYGKLIFDFNTLNYPELKPISHTNASTDYAHFNSIIFDVDRNFIVSFRNIGIVKINRTTKDIMWVIGRNRNDFTGISTALLPYQQHDFRFIKKDGSYTIFDNFGHETKSRVLNYFLDEKTMTATAIEYLCTWNKSPYMGSANMVDYENKVFDIAYGGAFNIAFEEYDFVNQEKLMEVKFTEGHDLYRIFRDTDLLYSQLRLEDTDLPVVTINPATVDKTQLQLVIAEANDLVETSYTGLSWETMQSALVTANQVNDDIDATQPEVDSATAKLRLAIDELVVYIPTPGYTVENEVFDGTRYIDTGLSLFNQNKEFSMVVKYQHTENSLEVGQYSVVAHCMDETGSPWPGTSLQLRRGTTNYEDAFALNFKTQNVFENVTPGTTYSNVFIAIFTRDLEGNTKVVFYNEDGTVLSEEEITLAYDPSLSYKSMTLYLGAANMGSTFDRYMNGTIFNFEHYSKALNDIEISAILDRIKTVGA